MTTKLTEGVDAGAVWHYGDPFREQKALVAGKAGVDLSHRPVFTVSGADRLKWLNDITSQDFANLAPGRPTVAYILDAQGRLTHVFGALDDGQTLWCHTEPGHLEPLLAWLRRMVFAARVEITDISEEHALVLPPASEQGPLIVSREEVEATLGTNLAGIWAMEAVRIASGVPRIFLDTDEKTIPNELANPEANLLGPAVHLSKGCYPGQETVARVYNLGRPPRRLTQLLLDGSVDRLPERGADVLLDGVAVGRMGTSERHYELGPIGLALLKRGTPVDAELLVDGIPAAQEILVDPDAGLHWRPERGLGKA
ncbi:MAG TPA: folate-binding protein [Propionicimonas sp.]|uniref:CAF17-like 4Fe-4S cluster assembly/insertion protein YgfZ n=1 Tax=Propionicimonas sp. TaxID=1955623 RepID=UPI002F40916F